MLQDRDVCAGVMFGSEGIRLTPFCVEIAQVRLNINGRRVWTVLEEYWDERIGVIEIPKLLAKMRVKRRIIMFWTGRINESLLGRLSGEYDIPIYMDRVSGPGSEDLRHRVMYSLMNSGCIAVSKERAPHLYADLVRGGGVSGGLAYDALSHLMVGCGEGPNEEDRMVPLADQPTMIRDSDGNLRENQPAVVEQWKIRQDPYSGDPQERDYNLIMHGYTEQDPEEEANEINRTLGIRGGFKDGVFKGPLTRMNNGMWRGRLGKGNDRISSISAINNCYKDWLKKNGKTNDQHAKEDFFVSCLKGIIDLRGEDLDVIFSA